MKAYRFKVMILSLLPAVSVFASDRIYVAPVDGDATVRLQEIIDSVRLHAKGPVEIALSPARYVVSRRHSSKVRYFVSNTSSESEVADPVKHIGMWLKGLSDVTIDGCGAVIETAGEMTPWVIDSCENVVIRNLTVTAQDPTVPEMTVVQLTDSTMTVRVTSPSRYTIDGGKLSWTGEDWKFTDGIAQIYYPDKDVTVRCPSPLVMAGKVEEDEDGLLTFYMDRMDGVRSGDVFQMRHGIRNEVAGFINRSRNVTLDHLKLEFMGNFGIVAQYSENLTYSSLSCAPDGSTGRTCAGFADFLQISGCKGSVNIDRCTFIGSHDDPVNVHGTHLEVTEWLGERSARVRFMHHQTYGFPAFYAGDEVDITDSHSLLAKWHTTVRKAVMLNERDMYVEFSDDVPADVREIRETVIENVTWTPEVNICGCVFMRTPTRAILVSTRRNVNITGNYFKGIPMSAVLIADDARSWYESGPVDGVVISDNVFEDCASPVIAISPEYDRYEGPVHRNVAVERNLFTGIADKAVSARGVDGLVIRDNIFVMSPGNIPDETGMVTAVDCDNISVAGNALEN